MKKKLLTHLCIFLSLSAFAIGDADFAGGNGTQLAPWQITTAAQLDAVRNNNGTNTGVKYFKLMNDIDLNNLPMTETGNWTPISTTAAFIDFDGNGYVIKNLTIIKGTTTSPNYQSFAGVLQGSIRNLGLVNVNIDAPKVGSCGAFAGYVGGAKPGANSYATGRIENCYATGYISSGGATGGIAGYVGRHANDGTPSYIKNCYFSGQLYNSYTGAGLSAFTGGIAGGVLVHDIESATTTAPIQNCYATGYFEAEKQKVGGIVGYTEARIKDCVSYANLMVKDEANDYIGLITGYCTNGPKGIASGTTATTYGVIDNCYAYDGTTMTKGSNAVIPQNFTTPLAGNISPVDGTLKDLAYLTTPINYYTQINFPMAGEQALWSQTLNGKYLRLLWVSERSDSDSIDGLSNVPTSVEENNFSNKPVVFSSGNLIGFRNITEPFDVTIFDMTGKELKRINLNGESASVVISSTPIVIVRMLGKSGATINTKIVRK